MRNSLTVPDPLLVSCPNGGGLALLDGELCLRLSDADCTGIAVGRDSVMWCLQGDGAKSVRELRDGQVRTVQLSDEPLDLHDILLHDGDIFVAATQTNEVLRLDRRLVVRERWSLGGEPDSSHLNSLAVHGDRLLASVFGRFETHRGYKGRSRGAGQVIDVRTGETLLEGLSQPHSIVVDGDLFYVCSSEDKEVVVYEGRKKVRTIALPGYTRGLAIGREHVYVGLSCSRNLEIESQTGYFESGAVAILRKADMGMIGTVQVPWREVYDIRIMDDRLLLQSVLAACWERERSSAATDIAAIGEAHETELATLRKQLAEANAQATAKVAQLQHDSLAQLARTESQVRKLEQQVASLNEVVRKRGERLARVRISHAEVGALAIRRQLELENKDSRIAELEHVVSGLQEGVELRDRNIQELEAGVSGLQRMNQELSDQMALRSDRIDELGAALSAAEASEVEFRNRIDELEAALSKAEANEFEFRRRTSDLTIKVALLEEVSREFEEVKQSRSWRLTRPLRFAMRLLRNRGLVESDRQRVLSWLGRSHGTDVAAPCDGLVGLEPPVPRGASAHDAERGRKATKSGAATSRLRKSGDDVALQAQERGLEDVFVWAVIDWHFRIQRPQHLARELAATGRRVFYISNNFIDSREPGFTIEPLDEAGRLFQVFLHVPGKPVIYFDPPGEEVQAQLDASLRRLLSWTRSNGSVSLVQHPFWALVARILPNHRLVYDCMDHHGGFDNNSFDILALENELMRTADLLVVSSAWLDEEGAKFNGNRALVRNAAEHRHFSRRPADTYADPEGRRVIGYYGAIAQWFDLELVERVAEDNPDCLVLLVGADTCKAGERLSRCPNVAFTGEVPYSRLPYYLHGFDVCMLPFRVLPLTLATNPVKAYEYLSAGKPVVTVDLPEMRQFGDLVAASADAGEFLDNVRRSLAEAVDDPVRERRRAFAADQTWSHRAEELVQAIARIPEPRVSIVVLAYNNLELTKACLDSIERHTDHPNFEVIVVDNASSDGSREYLRQWASGSGNRKVLLNAENKGFAAGNNQGLEAAEGDYLVLLNNDTQVTPGWLRTLAAHLRKDASIGIIGPVTDNIGNEAKIEIDYDDAPGMLAAAADYTLRHAGALLDVRTVAFFCVMIPRHVYERIGGLDENFGVGFFEDDDYCRRVEALGLRVACAEDVFVHHHLSASFGKLASAERRELFERNKAIYESKWGAWAPHRYRGKDGA